MAYLIIPRALPGAAAPCRISNKRSLSRHVASLIKPYLIIVSFANIICKNYPVVKHARKH